MVPHDDHVAALDLDRHAPVLLLGAVEVERSFDVDEFALLLDEPAMAVIATIVGASGLTLSSLPQHAKAD